MISKGRVIRVGVFFSIANFLITAGIGALLRFNTIFLIPGLNDRYWIHAHSHVGFLGWVFTILIILCFGFFMPKNARINRKVYRLIIYFQVSILGMLATFPFMGYATPSIIFSTLHMILSVAFVILFFKNNDGVGLAVKFMKAGLIFMLISSLGPLALGPIIVGGMKGTEWYDMAIYYYLHFQYNGWFTFAVFALLMQLLEQTGLKVEKGSLLYVLLIIGTIMTLALSALGFGFSLYTQIVGMTGAVLQLLAAWLLLKILFRKDDFRKLIHNQWVRWFYGVALFSWLVKIVMQFLSALPIMADFIFYSRDAIMTYLHLSFLGFTSSFIVGLLIDKKYLSIDSVVARFGYILFLVGVVTMELTIGIRSIPQYLSLDFYKHLNSLLFFESIILLMSVLIMLFYGFILSNKALKQKSIS